MDFDSLPQYECSARTRTDDVYRPWVAPLWLFTALTVAFIAGVGFGIALTLVAAHLPTSPRLD